MCTSWTSGHLFLACSWKPRSFVARRFSPRLENISPSCTRASEPWQILYRMISMTSLFSRNRARPPCRGTTTACISTVATGLGGVVGLLVRYSRILWTIVRFCAVYGWINRSNHETDKRFFNIPAIINILIKRQTCWEGTAWQMAFGGREARFNDRQN